MDTDKLIQQITSRCPCFELSIEECNCSMETLEETVKVAKSNKKPIILGLCGFSESGKDTVANYLVEQYDFDNLSFGYSLKDSLSYTFDVPSYLWASKQWVSEPCAKFGGRTPRQVLQHYGTEVARRINPDVWVNKVRNHLENLKGLNVVLTDIRFPNEADLLREFGGKLVYVYRPNIMSVQIENLVLKWGVNKTTSFLASLIDKKYGHVSELYTVLLKQNSDFRLSNTSTKSNLYSQIDTLMGELK